MIVRCFKHEVLSRQQRQFMSAYLQRIGKNLQELAIFYYKIEKLLYFCVIGLPVSSVVFSNLIIKIFAYIPSAGVVLRKDLRQTPAIVVCAQDIVFHGNITGVRFCRPVLRA